MNRRGYDEELSDIPSMKMSKEDMGDYHRQPLDRITPPEHHADTQAHPQLLWVILGVSVGFMLLAGYFIADLRSQLSASREQLQTTITQIDTLASTDKKVSTTREALQDQLKTIKSDLQKLQNQLTKLQQDNKTALDQQAQATLSLDKKIIGVTAKVDENKATLLSAQEALKKNQPDTAGLDQQSAKLKELEAKVNELSLDVMARQEQVGGPSVADPQKLAQIEEQIKSIDAYRQSTNATLDKMQTDINKLYLSVDELK